MKSALNRVLTLPNYRYRRELSIDVLYVSSKHPLIMCALREALFGFFGTQIVVTSCVFNDSEMLFNDFEMFCL